MYLLISVTSGGFDDLHSGHPSSSGPLLLDIFPQEFFKVHHVEFSYVFFVKLSVSLYLNGFSCKFSIYFQYFGEKKIAIVFHLIFDIALLSAE